MTFPITTTLRRIFEATPWEAGRQQALAAASKTEPDDEPITFSAIVETVDFDDALWYCRAEPQHSRLWRLYAVWCARQVQHLMVDPRSFAAIDVAERHANGMATDEELCTAWSDADDAAWAAADAAADADKVAGDAAWAAYDAAWAAAEAAANDAACAAAYAAAWAAASDVERTGQRSVFVQLVTTGTLPPVKEETYE